MTGGNEAGQRLGMTRGEAAAVGGEQIAADLQHGAAPWRQCLFGQVGVRALRVDHRHVRASDSVVECAQSRVQFVHPPVVTGPGRYTRSEGRRVGKEDASTYRTRWSPYT